MSVSAASARRIALAAQGFTDRRPTGRVTVRHFRRVMDRMAVLQLDSVTVLCRSHYLPVLARLGPYDRDALDRYLYRSGEHFEFLAHEAAIAPQRLHPHLRHRMGVTRWKRAQQLEADHPGYIDAVEAEVADRGPLTVSDLSEAGERTGPWWGYSDGKIALEHLYRSGRLAIAQRLPGFVIAYDLPDRVIEADALAAPDLDAGAARVDLIRIAARSHGIGTAHDMADYFRIRMGAARPAIDALVASGELQPVAVAGWAEPAYLHAEAARPRRVRARALLSPFDPVVWFRPRAERLFGFRYRIEIYVPADQRVHGDYVLPFLLDDDLAARVDLKADRKRGRLLVRGSYLESGRDAGRVGPELVAALAEMATWLDLGTIEIEPRGDLAPTLAGLV
ncbi:MAG: winged helix-turn-helix domain-containing protein [Acidimicrobiales bacterium]